MSKFLTGLLLVLVVLANETFGQNVFEGNYIGEHGQKLKIYANGFAARHDGQIKPGAQHLYFGVYTPQANPPNCNDRYTGLFRENTNHGGGPFVIEWVVPGQRIRVTEVQPGEDDSKLKPPSSGSVANEYIKSQSAITQNFDHDGGSGSPGAVPPITGLEGKWKVVSAGPEQAFVDLKDRFLDVSSRHGKFSHEPNKVHNWSIYIRGTHDLVENAEGERRKVVWHSGNWWDIDKKRGGRYWLMLKDEKSLVGRLMDDESSTHVSFLAEPSK